MTLIAATTNNDFPVLIGDIMISSLVEKSIMLPTLSIDIDPYLDPNMINKPSGFYQKIYVVNAHAAVALAGDVDCMKWFLQELRLRCSYFDRLNGAKIKTFLNDIQLGDKIRKFAFLLLWMEDGDDGLIQPMQITVPSQTWIRGESAILKEVFACGSGAKTFMQWVTQNMSWEFSDPNARLLTAITQNMIFLGTILASERTSLRHINELWGAGFELIFYGQEGFAKFNNHAFVLVEGTFDGQGNLSPLTPNMIQYYRYQEDILLITAIELLAAKTAQQNNSELTISDDNNESFCAVPSLDSSACDDRFNFDNNTSFKTNKIVIGYSINIKEQIYTYPGFYFEGSEAEISYENRCAKVKLPMDVTMRMREEIIRGINKLS